MGARYINIKNQMRRMHLLYSFFAQLTTISPDNLGQFKHHPPTIMSDIVTRLKDNITTLNNTDQPTLSLYTNCKHDLHKLSSTLFAFIDNRLKLLGLPEVAIHEIQPYIAKLKHDFENLNRQANNVFKEMLMHFYNDYLAILIALGCAPASNELAPIKLEENSTSVKKTNSLGYILLTNAPHHKKITTMIATHPQFTTKDKKHRQEYVTTNDIILAHHATFKNRAIQTQNANQREQQAANKFSTLKSHHPKQAQRLNKIMRYVQKRDYCQAIKQMINLPEGIRRDMGSYLSKSRDVSYLKNAMLDESFRYARKYGIVLFKHPPQPTSAEEIILQKLKPSI